MIALPHIIGHRGAAGIAPENTLGGFRAAAALGVSWVEFDVQMTADGRAVVLHDDTLDRTTDGGGPVTALSLDEIAAFDAGLWFDPAFAGETVPTLEEAIDLLGDLGVGANIEIKQPADAAAVSTLVDAIWPETLPLPLISSFSTAALGAARDAAPRLPRGLLLDVPGSDWRDLAVEVDAASIHCNHLHLTSAKSREIRSAGYPLLAYTVNHAGRAEELFGWGVNAIFSDVPGSLFAANPLYRDQL